MRFCLKTVPRCLTPLLLVATVAACRAQAPAPAATNAAGDRYAADLAAFGRSPDYLVRPGLLACRTSRWVRVAAETVGLGRHDPAEFVLITPGSGHDYEALAVAQTAASNVHEALVFIGVTPGRPVNPSALQFWPKGERVQMAFELPAPPGGAAQEVAAEDLLFDTRTGKPLPRTGWVFTGSRWLEAEGDAPRRYAADAAGPNAIASTYNDAGTVLDLPWRAGQGEVYGKIVANPDHLLPKKQAVHVWFRPEPGRDRPRTRELTLAVAPAAGGAANGLPGVAFTLRDTNSALRQDAGSTALLAAFGEITEAGQEPFVALQFATNLTLGAVREACRFLSGVEGERGIRVEPPPAGQPYYQAFLPSESFRERAKRPVQPWELHLSLDQGRVKALLRQIDEQWPDGAEAPVYKVEELEVASPGPLPGLLARKRNPAVVLVFAPTELTYGALLAYTEPAQRSHPTLYVYLPRTEPAP